MKIELVNNCDVETIYNMASFFTTYYSSIESIEEYINNEYNFIYTISDENNIIGFIHILYATDSYEIINLYVLDDYRNKGVGTDLINYVKNRIKMPLFLEVEDSNHSAINLYKKKGFTEIVTRKDYYGENRDAIIMSLECEK